MNRTLRVRKEYILPLTSYLIQNAVNDLTIDDPPLEAVIDQVYRNGFGAEAQDEENKVSGAMNVPEGRSL